MAVQVDKAVEAAALRELGVDALDQITEAFAHYLFSYMPREDGHAHEAFATAIEKVPLPKTREVPDAYSGFRSGDPEAKSRGVAGYSETNDSVSVSLEARLKFLRPLEMGGTIRVGDLSGNKGPKLPEGYRGELYAPRKKGNTGLLAWRDESGQHFAKIRRISPGKKFFALAIKQARMRAKQLGLKRKR